MIVVVDSGVANIASVTAALGRLGVDPVVTADAQLIRRADKVILPGVGAAAAAMAKLQAKGLVEALRALTQPVLGICLGLQLLFEESEESGGVACLGALPGRVALLPGGVATPVPHIGWNQLTRASHLDGVCRSPLLEGVEDGAYVYFVHSYAAPVTSVTAACATYGAAFTAVAAKGNFMGCQFHPERSGATGSRILKNFLGL